MVMYLGNMIELTDSASLYGDPLHPYTKALLSAVPIPDPAVHRERIVLQGDVPSPIDPPSGCVFRTRCPVAMGICSQVKPAWREVKPGHFKHVIYMNKGKMIFKCLVSSFISLIAKHFFVWE